MSALVTPPLALYVHFPWCVRKCPYCDFNSYTLSGELPAAAYVGRLARDLEAQSAEVAGRSVVSVFFGGGTPSLFSPESIARVLAAARRHLALDADAEVTLEANPGTPASHACRSGRKVLPRSRLQRSGASTLRPRRGARPRSCTRRDSPTSIST